MADAPRISIEDVQARIFKGEDFVFIDTRNPRAWAESDVKIPGAIRVPLDALDDALPDIPKDKPIVTYCT
jgi:Rhodanese-related sulfurtransferase